MMYTYGRRRKKSPPKVGSCKVSPRQIWLEQTPKHPKKKSKARGNMGLCCVKRWCQSDKITAKKLWGGECFLLCTFHNIHKGCWSHTHRSEAPTLTWLANSSGARGLLGNLALGNVTHDKICVLFYSVRVLCCFRVFSVILMSLLLFSVYILFYSVMSPSFLLSFLSFLFSKGQKTRTRKTQILTPEAFWP